jgi:hypothetical protein
MSDEGNTPKAVATYEHYCSVAGCKKWGGLGFAASKSVETRWWCDEHYPHWEGKRTVGNDQ